MIAPNHQDAFRVSRSNEISEHAKGFDDFEDHRYYLLKEKSKFQGAIKEFSFKKKFRITEEFVDAPAMEQICHIPKDKVMLVNVTSNEDVLLNGRYINTGTFHISSGKSIHAIGRNLARVYIVIFDRDFFFETMRLTDKRFSECLPFEAFVSPGAETVSEFQTAIGPKFFNESDGFNDCNFREASFNSILGAIDSVFLESERDISCRASASTRSFVVNKSCEYFAENIQNESFGVPDICRYLRVSRRTLQYSFQEVMDISPSEYIRSIRLNAARKQILNSSGYRIHDAAIDSGFNHVGRFSNYYKSFYGELPSDTVRKRVAITKS